MPEKAVITEAMRQKEKVTRPFVNKYSALMDLDPDVIRAIISNESHFVATATSPTGAYGYGQFTSIAVKQVQNIARMNPAVADLVNFSKAEASDPDRGIKAICATLWWLFHVKYASVSDKKTRLEAVLTFYNAGGKAAALVVKYGGHTQALPYIKTQLSPTERSQADVYVPRVIVWFIQWHEFFKSSDPLDSGITTPESTPDPVTSPSELPEKYKPLLEALQLLHNDTDGVSITTTSREGMTEINILIPGEYSGFSIAR